MYLVAGMKDGSELIFSVDSRESLAWMLSNLERDLAVKEWNVYTHPYAMQRVDLSFYGWTSYTWMKCAHPKEKAT